MAHSPLSAPLPSWKRLIKDSQLNPWSRHTSLSPFTLRARLAIAALGWFLLIAFFWVTLSNPVPQWLQAVGWILAAAWLLFLSSLRVRAWNAHRSRG